MKYLFDLKIYNYGVLFLIIQSNLLFPHMFDAKYQHFVRAKEEIQDTTKYKARMDKALKEMIEIKWNKLRKKSKHCLFYLHSIQ